MTSKTKMMLAAAAMSGFIAGTAARSTAAPVSAPNQQVSVKAKKVTADNGNSGKKDDSKSSDTKGKHDCKGKNDCKGQGGCKTSDGGCKGKNSCKGKGGCKTNEDKTADKK